MLIDDKRIKVGWTPIGVAGIETIVQFHDGTYGMVISHDMVRGITCFYDFNKHKLDRVVNEHLVITCDAKLVLQGGACL